MKLPAVVPVRGAKWRVVEKAIVLDSNGTEVAGTTSMATRTIEIESNLDDEFKLEVFLHEYGHAICAELGLDDEGVPSWLEHMIVIAYAKDMVLNRKLFAQLFGVQNS